MAGSATKQPHSIVSHIHSLYAAKVAAYARDDNRLEIRLDKEETDHAVYIDTSTPGVTYPYGPRYEQRIDEKYLNGSQGSTSYRVETFRSSSKLPGGIVLNSSSLQRGGEPDSMLSCSSSSRMVFQSLLRISAW